MELKVNEKTIAKKENVVKNKQGNWKVLDTEQILLNIKEGQKANWQLDLNRVKSPITQIQKQIKVQLKRKYKQG